MINKIAGKLNGMTSGQLWEIVFELKDKSDSCSDVIFTEALNILETKVDDETFTNLMEKL